MYSSSAPNRATISTSYPRSRIREMFSCLNPSPCWTAFKMERSRWTRYANPDAVNSLARLVMKKGTNRWFLTVRFAGFLQNMQFERLSNLQLPRQPPLADHLRDQSLKGLSTWLHSRNNLTIIGKWMLHNCRRTEAIASSPKRKPRINLIMAGIFEFRFADWTYYP